MGLRVTKCMPCVQGVMRMLIDAGSCAALPTCRWTSAACRTSLIMSKLERSIARFSSLVSRHR